MIALPRALLLPAEGRPAPAGGQGMIRRLPADGARLAEGALVLHEAGGPGEVEVLKRAIAAGAGTIVLAACRRGADIQRLDVLLSVAEAEAGRPAGAISLLALTDGILPAAGAPEGFSGKSGRLAGLVWDDAALAAALGTRRSRTGGGEWTGAFAAARAAVLLAAHAAGVPAYDGAASLDGEAFAADCRRSRDDGFFGRLVRHDAQAEVAEAVYGGD